MRGFLLLLALILFTVTVSGKINKYPPWLEWLEGNSENSNAIMNSQAEIIVESFSIVRDNCDVPLTPLFQLIVGNQEELLSFTPTPWLWVSITRSLQIYVTSVNRTRKTTGEA